MSKKVKNFAIVIIVISLIIGIFTIVGNNETISSGTFTSNKGAGIPINQNEPVQNDEFGAILADIKDINIDTTLFEDPTFKALRDYPISLGSDVVGRDNPFAPVGTDADGATSEIDFQTVQPISITSKSAELVAQINIPGDDKISAYFEYGTTSSFGTSVGPVVFSKNGTAIAPISNLAPSTKYFVRAILVNDTEIKNGNTMSFTTKAK